MKNFYLNFFFTFFSVVCIAQTNFKEGYYISSNGEKIIGLIKNIDWKNNPMTIEFKESELTNTTTVEIEDILEFEIEGLKKYKKFNILIDKSSTKTSYLKLKSEPIFVNETVLLKVLVDGETSLLEYEENGLIKYFYSKSNNEIEQLIFRKYFVNEDEAEKLRKEGNYDVNAYTSIVTDEQYKKQLFQNVNCNATREYMKDISYTKNSLVNYFKKYNECKNVTFKTFERKQKVIYKLKAMISGNFQTFDLNYLNDSYYSNDFENKFGVGLGAELEVILPFNNNKWGAFTNLTINKYENSSLLKQESAFTTIKQQEVNILYEYYKLELGVRYYMFVNENLKLFIDAKINQNFSSKKSIVSYENGKELPIFPSILNYGTGIGVNFKQFDLSLNTNTKSQILNLTSEKKYGNYQNNFSVILRYTLL